MKLVSAILGGLALAVVAAGPFAPAFAGDPKVSVNEAGLAIRGYDPVAYFELGRPVKGSRSYVAKHDGAVYRFSSARHLALFQADPDKYVPAYGGYCSYGMRHGQTSPIDPHAWKIVGGRLYLLYDQGTQAVWLTNIAENIDIADRVWRKLLGGS